MRNEFHDGVIDHQCIQSYYPSEQLTGLKLKLAQSKPSSVSKHGLVTIELSFD